MTETQILLQNGDKELVVLQIVDGKERWVAFANKSEVRRFMQGLNRWLAEMKGDQ